MLVHSYVYHTYGHDYGAMYRNNSKMIFSFYNKIKYLMYDHINKIKKKITARYMPTIVNIESICDKYQIFII